MKIKMLVTYDGTDFCGWQKQKDHAHASPLPSIQGTMESALQEIFGHSISLSASGRTDAGVHAIGQVCHFETDRRVPKDLSWAMKSKLPPSISIKTAWEAPEDFHSTLSAVKKTYRYWVWNQPRGTALLHRYSWWVRKPLDLENLNALAETLLGRHDFASYRSVGTPVAHTVREIYAASWSRRKSGILEFKVTGNGFMKQMVRNLVGTQVDLALKSPEIGLARQEMGRILEAKDRTEAGRAAPAQGLFLQRVFYPASLDNRCRPI